MAELAMVAVGGTGLGLEGISGGTWCRLLAELVLASMLVILVAMGSDGDHPNISGT